jgi:hypothetical protein
MLATWAFPFQHADLALTGRVIRYNNQPTHAHEPTPTPLRFPLLPLTQSVLNREVQKFIIFERDTKK